MRALKMTERYMSVSNRLITNGYFWMITKI